MIKRFRDSTLYPVPFSIQVTVTIPEGLRGELHGYVTGTEISEADLSELIYIFQKEERACKLKEDVAYCVTALTACVAMVNFGNRNGLSFFFASVTVWLFIRKHGYSVAHKHAKDMVYCLKELRRGM